MRGYHDGERAVQRRAGDRTTAERLERGLRSEVPDVARGFLARIRLLFAGSTDADGRLWCSVLSGAPGFVGAPDDRTVTVVGEPAVHDPLAGVLDAGPARVGLLAIEPQTRRRMRVNGTATRTPDGFRVAPDQVYSNCRKYIAHREVVEEAPRPAAPVVTERAALSAADRALIAAADTFVIATGAPDGSADASHRGGSPGFVTVHDERRLSFPDYAGNTMFMTLGNITAKPRAGLLFIDWDTGDTLQLSGGAAVDWSSERAAAIPGAERVVDIAVERVIHAAGALPLRWMLEERSRFNPPAAAA